MKLTFNQPRTVHLGDVGVGDLFIYSDCLFVKGVDAVICLATPDDHQMFEPYEAFGGWAPLRLVTPVKMTEVTVEAI